MDVSCTTGHTSVIWSVEVVSVTLYAELFVVAQPAVCRTGVHLDYKFGKTDDWLGNVVVLDEDSE